MTKVDALSTYHTQPDQVMSTCYEAPIAGTHVSRKSSCEEENTPCRVDVLPQAKSNFCYQLS
jgi:hypothetical protein